MEGASTELKAATTYAEEELVGGPDFPSKFAELYPGFIVEASTTAVHCCNTG